MENGRELASIKSKATNAIIASYEYDSSGLRISKTTPTETVYYAYDENANLIFEKHDSFTLAFHYDGNGIRTHFDHITSSATNTYYYRYNLQGDVIALLNSAGTVVANYEYTPYGKEVYTPNTIGSLNPFRYKGYYFDSETSYYYLQSRYYDPEICRFINADDPDYLDASGTLLGLNLYTYCENDPVNRIDFGGDKWVYVYITRVELKLVPKTKGFWIFKKTVYELKRVTVTKRVKVWQPDPKPRNPYKKGQNVATNKKLYTNTILASCSLYVQKRGATLGYNMRGISGNGNVIATNGIKNRKDLSGKIGNITASDLRSNSILSFSYSSGKYIAYGHVIYIEFVDGNTVYYTEGGTSQNGIVKTKTASALLKNGGIGYGSVPVAILYLA